MQKPHTFQAAVSNIKGSAWPALHSGSHASLAALMHQLEETQWLPAAAIERLQQRQLLQVAAHAERQSSQFRERLRAAGMSAGDLATREGLQRLPVLTRRAIQASGETLYCRQTPKQHLPIGETRTSGSSGEPVVVKRTQINQLFWLAATLREHLWQRRDFQGRLASIRANQALDGPQDQADWGPPASLFFPTGTAHTLKLGTDIERQIEWLRRIDPDYLITYPTNLSALLRQIERGDIQLPRLRQIRTIGETLSADLRVATRTLLNVEIADIYSSQEFGILALQCPESGLYHSMAESHIIEALDDDGRPCAAGQVGRAVITDLHNFATPLIRYQIGDFIEVGPPCPCGRGLPTLQRIAGRERNMLVLPDGRRHWPLVGFASYRDIAPIRQYQLIQRDLTSIEMRLVTDSPLSAAQEARLSAVVCDSLGYAFQVRFAYFPAEIPRSRGGKFEEFVCEVTSAAATR